MNLALVGRFFHTLRYLKFRQFFFRFYYLVYKGSKPKKSSQVSTRKIKHTPQKFISREDSLIGPYQFVFLNEMGGLDDLGWEGGDVAKLWRYNQHYFDFINSKKSSDQLNWHVNLMSDWVQKNKPGEGVGWEPYPTSIRIVNWVKWTIGGRILPKECLESLSVQAAWLNTRIEFHILGNHLFANAKALVYAGLFFEGPEADRWLKKGMRLISDELQEQILLDGGHFELSTMYHSIFLEDLLDLINLGKLFPEKILDGEIYVWRKKAGQMINWLDSMIHPDGEISFFNDAAFRVASRPNALFEYAERLDVYKKNTAATANVIHLNESGYVRIGNENQVLILDVAKVGPDYLPGHAHADTLSFELSLFNERIFVNGGTSEYGCSDIRSYERSTAAHNTVVINQENSSEVWAGFRVARRAYPFELEINQSGTNTTVTCKHNGYERFINGLIHSRSWRSSNASLHISDFVSGDYSEAFAYYHLSPDIQIISVEVSRICIATRSQKIIILDFDGSSFEIVDGIYAREFGRRTPNKCFKLGLDKNGGASLRVSWG